MLDTHLPSPSKNLLTSRSQMPFVKVVKNDAYFSRFQVKYRRRREGKTDCERVSLSRSGARP